MSVEVKCATHPRNQAKKAPKTACGTCDLLWHLRCGGTLVSEALEPSLDRNGRKYWPSTNLVIK
jgi:hypothetical protein